MTANPKASGGKLTGFLTFVAAGVATGVAGTGMWRFFGDVLHIDSIYLRAALFAFLEIALLVSAIRARRNLLDDIAHIAGRKSAAEMLHRDAITDEQRAAAAEELADVAKLRPGTGVDGLAVWGLAIMSGVFSALDAHSFAEGLFRLSAPLVAAWLWERGLAAHRRRHRKGRGRINWALSPERIAVRLGLAEPTGRDVSAIVRSRRLARLARSLARYHELPEKAFRRRARAARHARRSVERAIEHLALGTDPAVVAELLANLGTLYGVLPGTAPAVLRHAGPWGTGTPGSEVSPPSQHPVLILSEPSGRGVPAPLATPRVNGSGTPVPAPLNGASTPLAAPPPVGVGTFVRRVGTPAVSTPAPPTSGTGSGTPAPPVTSDGTPDGTPGDEEYLAVLRDPARVPREGDGTVPIKRAIKVLGVGRPRAIRLLDTLGLRRYPDPDDGASTPAAEGSGAGSDDDPHRVPAPPINGHRVLSGV